jgi:hypothetical protein
MSATFREASQARSALKMRLSVYSWYRGSHVQVDGDDWVVVINSSKPIDDGIRKAVPPVYEGVSVKTTNGK